MLSKSPPLNTQARAGTKLRTEIKKAKPFGFLDDQAVAYSWVLVLAVILIFAFVLAFVVPMINPIIDVMNGMISDGDMSQQTVDAFNWQLTLLFGAPALLLIGFFVYIVQRSIEVSQGGE